MQHRFRMGERQPAIVNNNHLASSSILHSTVIDCRLSTTATSRLCPRYIINALHGAGGGVNLNHRQISIQSLRCAFDLNFERERQNVDKEYVVISIQLPILPLDGLSSLSCQNQMRRQHLHLGVMLLRLNVL